MEAADNSRKIGDEDLDWYFEQQYKQQYRYIGLYTLEEHEPGSTAVDFKWL